MKSSIDEIYSEIENHDCAVVKCDGSEKFDFVGFRLALVPTNSMEKSLKYSTRMEIKY